MSFNLTLIENLTWINESIVDNECLPHQQQPQHVVYQLANICFIISYLAPGGKKGLLFMHSLLILGFFLFSMWGWTVVCSLNIFSWNFLFVLLNSGQILNILYTMRKVKLPTDLEDIYRTLFQPLQVTRLSFQKLVDPDCAQMLNMHPGEAYAMQNLTRTDRLGLLVKGKANVICGEHFLHPIYPKEFLDSPEFESSRSGLEEKFKVSIIATTPCRCIVWQRQNLELLLLKEKHLSNIISLILARDITGKLYTMNQKMVTEKGSHLDIRLPSFTGSAASQEEMKKLSGSVYDSNEFSAPVATDRPYASI